MFALIHLVGCLFGFAEVQSKHTDTDFYGSIVVDECHNARCCSDAHAGGCGESSGDRLVLSVYYSGLAARPFQLGFVKECKPLAFAQTDVVAVSAYLNMCVSTDTGR